MYTQNRTIPNTSDTHAQIKQTYCHIPTYLYFADLNISWLSLLDYQNNIFLLCQMLHHTWQSKIFLKLASIPVEKHLQVDRRYMCTQKNGIAYSMTWFQSLKPELFKCNCTNLVKKSSECSVLPSHPTLSHCFPTLCSSAVIVNLSMTCATSTLPFILWMRG